MFILTLSQTFDECVLGGYVCVRPKFYFRIITYFCGHDEMCTYVTK